MTQLGGGDGPVLVDTELTGFESLAKLWQPLDGFMEETGLVKEMYPETLELGKIDGVTYGIVRNFSIETLLVPASGPSDWNYEVFLDALDKFDGSALTYRGIELPCDGREKYFDILKNSMDDTYFLNWETGDILFGSMESILADEFGDYLAGAIDARMLDEHLKSRVWLFMEESK